MDKIDLGLLRTALQSISHSTLNNYALPGLTSQLLGGTERLGPMSGKLRLFTAERDTLEHITPHSHRFNLTCMVLRGSVGNRIYTRVSDEEEGDLFVESGLQLVGGGLGEYETHVMDGAFRYRRWDETYGAGQVYAMEAHEIHSIKFSRDAVVLLVEGPQVQQTTVILEPYVNGQRVPTFKTEPWMFTRPTLSPVESL